MFGHLFNLLWQIVLTNSINFLIDTDYKGLDT